MNGFRTMVEEAAVKARTTKEYDLWRASSLGKCKREHFYKRLGIVETTPNDGNGELRTGIGTKVHELIQDLLKEHIPDGVTKVETEVEVKSPTLNLGGRYDILMTGSDGTELYDIKTQQERAFWWMTQKSKGYTTKTGTVVPPKPISEQKREHVMQLMAYLMMLEEQGTPAEKGHICYWSLDTSLCEQYTFTLNDDWRKAVTDELNELNRYWKAKELPPCSCKDLYDGAGVRYCSFGSTEKDAKGKSSTCCSEKLWKS